MFNNDMEKILNNQNEEGGYLDFTFPDASLDTIKIPRKNSDGQLDWNGTEENNLLDFKKRFFNDNKKLHELAKNHADLLAKGIEENYKRDFPELEVSVLSDDNVLKDTKFYINIKFGGKQVYPKLNTSERSIAA